MKKLAPVLAFLFLLGGLGCEEIGQEPEVEAMTQALESESYEYYRVIDKGSYFYNQTGKFLEYVAYSRYPMKLYFETNRAVGEFSSIQLEGIQALPKGTLYEIESEEGSTPYEVDFDRPSPTFDNATINYLDLDTDED